MGMKKNLLRVYHGVIFYFLVLSISVHSRNISIRQMKRSRRSNGQDKNDGCKAK